MPSLSAPETLPALPAEEIPKLPDPFTTAPPSKFWAGLLFAFMAFVWGSTWLVIKEGLHYYPPSFSIAIRFIIAGPFFLVFMKLRREPIPWNLRHQPFFFLIGLLSFIISYGVVYWSEQYITSGLASIIFAVMPLLTGVVARFLIREHLGPMRLIGLIIGLAGIAIINSADLSLIHEKAPQAALVLLISPIVVSFSSVLCKQRMRDYSPFAFAAFPMIYGAIGHIILWVLLEQDRVLEWSWPGVAAIAYLTIFGSIITFGGYYWLLRHVEVGRLNLLAFLTPLVAVTMGVLLADEILSVRMLIGAAIVLVGVAMANRSPKRAEQDPT
jgi:drug/metabolite transporter (DMT)-like permease